MDRIYKLTEGPPEWSAAGSAVAYPALILLAMLGSLWLASSGHLFYENVLMLGLALAVIGIGLWSLSVQPALGLAAMAVAGLLVPFQVATGTRTTLNASFLLAAGLAVISMLRMADRRRKEARLSSAAVLPLALLLVVTVLSLLVGQFPWFTVPGAPLAAQMGGFGIIVLSGAVFWASARYLQDLSWLKRTTVLFMAVSALYVVLNLVPGLPNLMAPTEGALGSLFWTWLMSLSFAQAVMNREWNAGQRAAAGALVLAVLYLTAVERHDWASGWFPGCVAIVVILALRMPFFTSALVCIGGLAAALTFGSWFHLLWTPDQQYSLMTRMEAGKVLTGIIQKNPLLGLGPANYYHYTPVYSILGWHVNFSSHNNYLDMALQTGILGLGCLLWFFAALGRVALRLRRLAPQGFPRAYVYGSIGGLAGTLCAAALGDWVLPFVYNVGLKGFPASALGWLFLGGLVAIEQVCIRPSGPEAR